MRSAQAAVKTQIEFIMKRHVGNLCKIFVLAVVAIILNGCAISDLNKISIKKIKNEITGKTEKYGLIKVFEDEQDDHFLEVKILNQNLPANTFVMAKIIGYEKNYLTAHAL